MKEIREISDKLDFSVQISLSVSQEMGLLFAKLDDAIPLYATLRNNSAEISLYLDKSQRGKFEPSFGRLTQTSRGSFDIYELKAEELVSEFQMFRKVTQIPSVVLGGFFLRSGFVYADFRFHHSVLNEISKVVQKITEAKNRIRLSSLGNSEGLLRTIWGINNRIPLTTISFSYEPEEGYISESDVEVRPIAEAKLFSLGMESEYEAVYYASRHSGQGREIDAEEGIYESRFKSVFMKSLMGKIRSEKVPLAAVIGKYGKQEIENFFFVPSFMADELLNLIFDTAREVGNSTLKLTSFTPVENTLDEKIIG